MEEGKLPTSHPVDPVLHLFTSHLNQTMHSQRAGKGERRWASFSPLPISDTTLPHQQEVGAAAPESTETRSYPKVSAWRYLQLSPQVEEWGQFHIDNRLTLLGLPCQYQAGNCLINKKGELRLPNVQERKVILGLSSDYTVNCLPKSEQGGQFHIDTCLTLLGLPYEYQAGGCLTNKKVGAAAPESTGTRSYPRVSEWLYPQLSPEQGKQFHIDTRLTVLGLPDQYQYQAGYCLINIKGSGSSRMYRSAKLSSGFWVTLPSTVSGTRRTVSYRYPSHPFRAPRPISISGRILPYKHKWERRLPNVQEREVILGFLSDYILNCLPKWEQGGHVNIDTRLTLLGLPYRYQAGHCLTNKKGEAAAPECTGTQSYPRFSAWLYPQLSPHKQKRRAVSYRYSSHPFR